MIPQVQKCPLCAKYLFKHAKYQLKCFSTTHLAHFDQTYESNTTNKLSI